MSAEPVWRGLPGSMALLRPEAGVQGFLQGEGALLREPGPRKPGLGAGHFHCPAVSRSHGIREQPMQAGHLIEQCGDLVPLIEDGDAPASALVLRLCLPLQQVGKQHAEPAEQFAGVPGFPCRGSPRRCVGCRLWQPPRRRGDRRYGWPSGKSPSRRVPPPSVPPPSWHHYKGCAWTNRFAAPLSAVLY
jgi:hypothetical protein